MLRIGEFSALSGISIHMLRHYDKLGLLVPVSIDPISGYRYYEKEQLVMANKIVTMKSMGFGLEEIKRTVLMSSKELNQLFLQKLDSKQKELNEIQNQINKIEESIKFGVEGEYTLSVVKKILPCMHVVSYRNKIPEFNQEGILWGELMRECKQYGVHIPPASMAMAIQHEFNYDEKYVDVEVMLSTNLLYETRGNLRCAKISEKEVASIVFQGSYSQIGKINVFVAKWLEANGYLICGQPISIYHNSPRESEKEKEFLTELCFPISTTK